MPRTRSTTLGLALTLAALAACASPPTGSGSGRVEGGWSTPAEAGDIRVLPDDLVTFSSFWAQQLIQDLPDIPQLTDGPDRATIIYGDIRNRTDVMSTSEFEVVRERIKDELLASRTFTQNFRFLISRDQLEQLRAREVSDPRVGQRFEEANTYLLNGTMGRIGRGDTAYYYFNFNLVNFLSGEQVWSERYEGKRYGM